MKILTDSTYNAQEPRILIYGPTRAEIDKILASFPLIPGKYDEFINLKDAKAAAKTGKYTSAIIAYSSMHVDAKEMLDIATCGISGCIDVVCAAVDAIYDLRSRVWEIGENHLFRYTKEELDGLTLPLISMTTGLSPVKWISNIQTEFQQIVKRMTDDKRRIAMIYGASGTAKYSLTQVAHLRSDHKQYPFVFANCKTELGNSDVVWDSQMRKLFKTNIRSMLAVSDRGTLYFHKIDHLDKEAQRMIVEVLTDPYYYDEMSKEKVSYQGYIVFSTRHDIVRENVEKCLDDQLLKLVKGYAMHVPSLDENRDDIPMLAENLLRSYCHIQGIEVKRFSKRALKSLRDHGWYRNLRELYTIIKTAVSVSCGSTITEKAITIPIHFDKNDSDHDKRSAIKASLKKHHGCIEHVAKDFGVSRKTVHQWIEKYNISTDFIEDLRKQWREEKALAKAAKKQMRVNKKRQPTQ